MPFIEALVNRIEPGRALDLACGMGRHSLLLASHGWQVTAVDASQAAIDSIRAVDPRIESVHANLEKFEFNLEPDSWDLICVCLYLQRGLFESIRRGVRKGGRAVLANPMMDDREGVKPMNPHYLVSAGELEREFSGWRIEHECETLANPPSRKIAELIALKT